MYPWGEKYWWDQDLLFRVEYSVLLQHLADNGDGRVHWI